MNIIQLTSWLHDRIDLILTGFDLMGTLAFAISGALLGRKKAYNYWGVFALAFCTAVGGGTLRNMIINLMPAIFTDDGWMYVVAIVLATTAVYCGWGRFKFKDDRTRWSADRLLARADAIGLAVFVMIGATKALSIGLPFFAVIAFSVLTGAGGGIIRDVIAGEKPYAFQGYHYITWCVLGGTVAAVLAYSRSYLEPAIGLTAYRALFALLPTGLIILLRFREIQTEFPEPASSDPVTNKNERT